jgi:hypothetical protein
VILLLFPVRDDRRPRGFKPLNGISNRIFIERSEVRILTVAHSDSLDQINRSRDAANWLGGYRDWRRLGHTCSLTILLESIVDLTPRVHKDFDVFIVTRRTRTMTPTFF